MSAKTVLQPAPCSTRGARAAGHVDSTTREPITGNRTQWPVDQLAADRLAGLDRIHRLNRFFRQIVTAEDSRLRDRLAESVELLNAEIDPLRRTHLFAEVSALRDALEI